MYLKYIKVLKNDTSAQFPYINYINWESNTLPDEIWNTWTRVYKLMFIGVNNEWMAYLSKTKGDLY